MSIRPKWMYYDRHYRDCHLINKLQRTGVWQKRFVLGNNSQGTRPPVNFNSMSDSNDQGNHQGGGHSLSGAGPAEPLPSEWARPSNRNAGSTSGRSGGGGRGGGFSSGSRIGRIGAWGGSGNGSRYPIVIRIRNPSLLTVCLNFQKWSSPYTRTLCYAS